MNILFSTTLETVLFLLYSVRSYEMYIVSKKNVMNRQLSSWTDILRRWSELKRKRIQNLARLKWKTVFLKCNNRGITETFEVPTKKFIIFFIFVLNTKQLAKTERCCKKTNIIFFNEYNGPN